MLSDSTWFATGKALRLVKRSEAPTSVRQFNLQITTDLGYPGNTSANRSPIVTGCNGDCVPTQRLHLYTIPLRKGKFKLSKLDKRRVVDDERTNYWLLINGGGVVKNYRFGGRRHGWVRITRYDRQSNVIEGRFSFDLDENLNQVGRRLNSLPSVARFRDGLFRIPLEDVTLKD
ncbi:hypothetical protein [Fibrisoma limi]|nr:hypothetical protein [Fibrisoma limi]